MNNSSTVKYVIWALTFSSLLLSFFGHYTTAPGIIKAIYSLSLWFCVVKFPYNYVRNNDYKKIANIALGFIFILTIVAIVRSTIDDTGIVIGNKWVTMFGNPECIFMLLSPWLVYLSIDEGSIYYLKRALIVFLIIGTLFLVVNRYVTPSVLWFSTVFFPYMDKKTKLLIFTSLIVAVFRSFFDVETSRTTIILIGFALGSWFLAYKIQSKIIIKVFCTISIALPIIYVIPTLMNHGYSVFTIILNYVLDQTGNQTFATDTRTFLFWEMAEDLSDNSAWLLGKGAYSHYFSLYFSVTNEGDSYNRLSSEVTLLQLILRSGIVYAVTYYFLIVYAIYKAIKHSNNWFLLSVAMMACGWVFVSCMGYLNGCEFKHLGFFLLIGCCMSPYWLDKTDDEIQEILEA